MKEKEKQGGINKYNIKEKEYRNNKQINKVIAHMNKYFCHFYRYKLN